MRAARASIPRDGYSARSSGHCSPDGGLGGWAFEPEPSEAEVELPDKADRSLSLWTCGQLALAAASGSNRLAFVARHKNVLFTRRCIHFSLNDARRLEAVARAYALLAFTPKDSVEFVCMYGHSTTLAEDLERFRFLRSLPGAYVFVQQYKPPLDAKSVSPPPFFDTQADRLLDELVRICFPQNMKSMENYYRWASEAYYRHFGRLHGKLVDTIFRFNYRDLKGLYIAEHPQSERKEHTRSRDKTTTSA